LASLTRLGRERGTGCGCVALALQAALGLAQPRPTTRPGRQLLGQLVAAPIAVELVLGGVDGLGLFDDLARQLLVIDVRVATGVGVDLGAVDRDDPDLGQPGPRAEDQDLAEQPGHRRLVALDEPRDRRVIRPLLRGDDAEGDVLDARPLDDSRGSNPARVGVEQQRDHHRRLVGRAALAIDPVGRIKRPQIHLLDRGQHEPCQVVLRQPVADIGRHQK